jgi:chorismate-pyruvate lyase
MLTSESAHDPSAVNPLPWAALLNRCYSKLALPWPALERLKEDEVPQPYQALLVHSSDMTPTLEMFFSQPLGIKVLGREIHDDSYEREVLLTIAPEGRPVAYGVICIYLHHLPASARRRVLEEQRPLGNILLREAVPHISWPQAFFRVPSDRHTQSVLGIHQPCDLYGRRNVLLDGSRHLIADVVEILAPMINHSSAA